MKIIYTKGFLNDMEHLFSSSWRYFVPRFWGDWKFKIKMAWQRVFRGYDDSSVWSHHYWHAETTAKMMRRLAQISNGCPSALYDKKNKKDPYKRWKEILITIAEGFEAMNKIDNHEHFIENKNNKLNLNKTKQKEKILKNKFDKGMKLYHEYYQNLWD